MSDLRHNFLERSAEQRRSADLAAVGPLEKARLALGGEGVRPDPADREAPSTAPEVVESEVPDLPVTSAEWQRFIEWGLRVAAFAPHEFRAFLDRLDG